MNARTTHVTCSANGHRIYTEHRTPEGAEREAAYRRALPAETFGDIYRDTEARALFWSIDGRTLYFVRQHSEARADTTKGVQS